MQWMYRFLHEYEAGIGESSTELRRAKIEDENPYPLSTGVWNYLPHAFTLRYRSKRTIYMDIIVRNVIRPNA